MIPAFSYPKASVWWASASKASPNEPARSARFVWKDIGAQCQYLIYRRQAKSPVRNGHHRRHAAGSEDFHRQQVLGMPPRHEALDGRRPGVPLVPAVATYALACR
jgi:hypothetical protein